MMKGILIVGMLFIALSGFSQEIRIVGMVKDPNGQGIPSAIIVNNRTRQGTFGNGRGEFVLNCLKTDTLSITALSYYTRQLCFKDSVLMDAYHPTVYLDDRSYTLPVVEYIAPRDIQSIEEDLRKVGFNEDDYRLSGINAMQSPITFLYQQFSKKEQSRVKVAYMEYADKKRALLKELFHLYVSYEIIDLSNDEFDAFIDFMQVSDDFMRSSNQYEFLEYVKIEFARYKLWRKHNKQWKQEDFEYDKD